MPLNRIRELASDLEDFADWQERRLKMAYPPMPSISAESPPLGYTEPRSGLPQPRAAPE